MYITGYVHADIGAYKLFGGLDLSDKIKVIFIEYNVYSTNIQKINY